MARLEDVDLTQSMSKTASNHQIKRLQKRLLELRLLSAGMIGEQRLGPPICVCFEGWDAAGKGGAIKRLSARLDPRYVRVNQYGTPSEEERRHHYLWRFTSHLPGWGDFAIFDRTWYGRVLVERVEHFATEDEWGRAYEEIRDFERSLVEEGTTLVKFFLHISDTEQLRRFESRRDDPLRAWKLTDEDWRNRAKRPEYEEAIAVMLDRTDHPHCKWHVVAAESKHFARVEVLRTVVREIERGLAHAGISVPQAAGKDFDPKK